MPASLRSHRRRPRALIISSARPCFRRSRRPLEKSEYPPVLAVIAVPRWRHPSAGYPHTSRYFNGGIGFLLSKTRFFGRSPRSHHHACSVFRLSSKLRRRHADQPGCGSGERLPDAARDQELLRSRPTLWHQQDSYRPTQLSLLGAALPRQVDLRRPRSRVYTERSPMLAHYARARSLQDQRPGLLLGTPCYAPPICRRAPASTSGATGRPAGRPALRSADGVPQSSPSTI